MKLNPINIDLIYELQNLLSKSMPKKNTPEFEALKIVDKIIDEAQE